MNNWISWIIAFFPSPRKWFLQCAYAWALQMEHREGSARSVFSRWKSWYSLKSQIIWTCIARRLRWVSRETFFPVCYNLGSQKSVLCGYFDLITVVWVFRKSEDWCEVFKWCFCFEWGIKTLITRKFNRSKKKKQHDYRFNLSKRYLKSYQEK